MKEILILLLSSIWLCMAGFRCPNSCNGHGRCDPENVCLCDYPWTSPDCSQKICPYGAAWVDKARRLNDAHRISECSSKGNCNRDNGKCMCFPGYSGDSCERNDMLCGKFGVEISMWQLYNDYTLPSAAPVMSFNKQSQFADWNAQGLSACICDPGYTGPNCQLSK